MVYMYAKLQMVLVNQQGLMLMLVYSVSFLWIWVLLPKRAPIFKRTGYARLKPKWYNECLVQMGVPTNKFYP